MENKNLEDIQRRTIDDFHKKGKQYYADLASVLFDIKAKYGKYAILGNHDYKKRNKVIELYNNRNAK